MRFEILIATVGHRGSDEAVVQAHYTPDGRGPVDPKTTTTVTTLLSDKWEPIGTTVISRVGLALMFRRHYAATQGSVGDAWGT